MDGMKELICVSQKLGIDLRQLVAGTAIFAPLKAVQAVSGPDHAMYPYVRRARTSAGERRGQKIGRVLLDDNTYPNRGIKTVLANCSGTPYYLWKNWTVCHIWPATCYDTRYHTALPNLVMLPSAIAGLSDFYLQVLKDLQFRAWELFGWYPQSVAAAPLVQPQGYPAKWRTGLPCTQAGHTNFTELCGDIDIVLEEARTLPIEFDPDLAGFKASILVTRRAEIFIYYASGDFRVKDWKASRISTDSDIIGNLRSRKEFRQGAWQRAGIERIVLRAK